VVEFAEKKAKKAEKKVKEKPAPEVNIGLLGH